MEIWIPPRFPVGPPAVRVLRPSFAPGERGSDVGCQCFLKSPFFAVLPQRDTRKKYQPKSPQDLVRQLHPLGTTGSSTDWTSAPKQSFENPTLPLQDVQSQTLQADRLSVPAREAASTSTPMGPCAQKCSAARLSPKTARDRSRSWGYGEGTCQSSKGKQLGIVLNIF